MQSPQLSLSCIPCAKRKVRCDRSKPCSHCRRRRGDICEYPIPITSSRNNSRSTLPDTAQSKRIENLEQYIRSLGHDPNQASIPSPTTPSESYIPNNVPAVNLTLTQNIGVQRAPSSFFPTPRPRGSEQARLVEHNEQTIYIESCVFPLPPILLSGRVLISVVPCGTVGAKQNSRLQHQNETIAGIPLH